MTRIAATTDSNKPVLETSLTRIDELHPIETEEAA